MNRLLFILLLAAGTVYGQIDNPPTSTSILDATTVGRAVLTASNAAAARSAIEVTLTNLSSTPTLTALTNTGNSVLGTNSTNTVTVGGNLLVGGSIAVTNAAATRTNLGLGVASEVFFDSVEVRNHDSSTTTNFSQLGIRSAANGYGGFYAAYDGAYKLVFAAGTSTNNLGDVILFRANSVELVKPFQFIGTNAAANAGASRTNLGLGSTNNVIFNQVGASDVAADDITVEGAIYFTEVLTNLAVTRTNLGLYNTNAPAAFAALALWDEVNDEMGLRVVDDEIRVTSFLIGTNAPTDTTNAVKWIRFVEGTNSYRVPLYQ
jgi:hypothetical protein